MGVVFGFVFVVDSNRILYSKLSDYLASTFFIDSSTEEILKEAYLGAVAKNEKIRVLIVPGHDDEMWGTDFYGVKEANLTVALGEELFRLFRENSLFEAKISRTKSGYDPDLARYFEERRPEIQEFIRSHKATMREYIDSGKIKSRIIVEHATSTQEMIHKLYGINKWANENKIDFVIHIHFNDYAGRKKTKAGKYSGFSIYIPEGQYSNAKGSRAIADPIFERLSQLYPSSNLPKEDIGIVEDQELIGVGAFNTLDGAGVLIEYDYIYEPILQNKKIRQHAIADFAFQTYLGVMDFFTPSFPSATIETKFLPYEWKRDLSRGVKDSIDVLSLQTALIQENAYPPSGFSKNDCTLSGDFGPCTERAVAIFQKKRGIKITGRVGPKTRAILNDLHGE